MLRKYLFVVHELYELHELLSHPRCDLNGYADYKKAVARLCRLLERIRVIGEIENNKMFFYDVIEFTSLVSWAQNKKWRSNFALKH